MKQNGCISKRSRILVFPTVAFLFFVATAAWGQVSVTQPAGVDTVRAARDYATEVLYDRWDMNERTDLGWTIFNVDELPSPHLSGITFSNGIFSATTVLSDPANGQSDAIIPILDSDYTGSAHIGKFGINYPINADLYTHFLVRMYADPVVLGNNPAWAFGQLFWSSMSIYDGTYTVSNPFPISGGWVIYDISIPNLGISPASGADTATAWTGSKGSLRFDPTVIPNLDISIDWIRLVSGEALCYRTITWSGATTVDIYLDDDANAANGNLGLLKKGAAGTSYAFLAGGLASGNYYVALTTDEGASFSYSPGYYEVTEQPIAVFTKPSAEGSDQDFATALMMNPWDFDALTDVDLANKINSPEIKTGFTYEDLAGNVYTNNTVYYAKADIPASGVGDPQVFFLSAAYRGKSYQIDPSRFHNLVAKMGVYGNHSTNDGSVVRVLYMRTDQHTIGENVSQDIIIRHKEGVNPVMYKIVTDLRTLILEDGAGSPSHSGWTGIIDSFRIDPHEFNDGRAFFYDDVRITADWRADTSFTVEWTADAPAGATMSLYHDNDKTGYDGTLIAGGLAVSAGSYVWDTSAVAGGTYYLYAEITSGSNTNRVYATGPVIVDHSIPPKIDLSRTRLNFTKITRGKLTPVEQVTLSNSGDGVMSWTAVASEKWLSVMPKSGTGAATLSIKIVNVLAVPVGSYTGTVRIICPNASNSPQVINVYLTVKAAGSDAVPFGEFDIPAGAAASFGASVDLAGWALDDVAMKAVKIYFRKTPTKNKLIGSARFVAGARPGIEATYPDFPQNYKAGWTYTLKASQLPGGGVGTFTILAYAYDTGGHTVLLGTKTLTGTGTTTTGTGAPGETPDAPEDGATVSGPIRIVLPGDIPADRRPPTVWLDGLALGHPACDGFNALNAFDLDTTAVAEGWHTFALTAEAGGTESCYIRVRNDMMADEGVPDEDASPVVANPIKAARPMEEFAGIPEDAWSAIYVKHGFDENQTSERIYPETDGAVRIEMPAFSRIAVFLTEDGAFETAEAGESRVRRILREAKNPTEFRRFDAYALVGGLLRDLPIGASFDGHDGILYWQPGPGFVGEYVFVVVTNDGANPTRKTVKVTIKPNE